MVLLFCGIKTQRSSIVCFCLFSLLRLGRAFACLMFSSRLCANKTVPHSQLWNRRLLVFVFSICIFFFYAKTAFSFRKARHVQIDLDGVFFAFIEFFFRLGSDLRRRLSGVLFIVCLEFANVLCKKEYLSGDVLNRTVVVASLVTAHQEEMAV